MEEIRHKDRIFAYMIYAAAVGTILVSSIFSYPYLAVLAAVLLLLSVAYLHSGHLINSLIIEKAKIIEVSGRYRLSSSLGSLILREAGAYKSVSIAVLTLSSKISDQAGLFNDIIEKTRIPFEFSLALVPVDKRKVLEGLQTRLQMKEIMLTHANQSDYMRVNSLKRDMEVISGDISSISGGNSPVEVVAKLKSFATGGTEGEASRASFKQLEQLCMMFSSTFNLSYTIANGEDLFELL